MFETDKSDKPPWSHQSYTYAKGVALRQEQLNTLKSVDDMVGKITKQMKHARRDAEHARDLHVGQRVPVGPAQHRGRQALAVPAVDPGSVPERWPGHVAAGATDDRLVAGIDLLPTILQATGVSPTLKYPLDGRSLLDPTARSRLHYEYYKSPDDPRSRAGRRR